MDSLAVAPARALDGEQIARVGEIYLESFAAHHRVPFEELTRTGPSDALYVALDGGQSAGLAALRLLDPADLVFLRYFAIDAQRRRRGLGRRAWQLVREAVAADGWPARVVFEVEHPGEAGNDEAERRLREGRVRFWESCGARLLPVSGYVMPDFTSLHPPEIMLLMATAPAADFRADRLRDIVLAIYSGRYGLPADDPIVARALASVCQSRAISS